MNNIMFHIIFYFSYLSASGRIEEKNWLKSDKPNKRKIQKEDDLSKRTRKDVQTLNPYEKPTHFEEQLDKGEAFYYDLELPNFNPDILQHEEDRKIKSATKSTNEAKKDDFDIDGFLNQIYEKEKMYLPNKPRVFATKIDSTDDPYAIEDNTSPKHYTDLDEYVNDSLNQHLTHQEYKSNDTLKQITDLVSSEVIINDSKITINKENNKDNSIQLEGLLPSFQQIYGEQQLSSDEDKPNVIETGKGFNENSTAVENYDNLENELNFDELKELSFHNNFINQVCDADKTLIESNIEDRRYNDMATSTDNVDINCNIEKEEDKLPVLFEEYNEQKKDYASGEMKKGTTFEISLSKYIQKPILNQLITLSNLIFFLCNKNKAYTESYAKKIKESKNLAERFYTYIRNNNSIVVGDEKIKKNIIHLLYEADGQSLMYFSEIKFRKFLSKKQLNIYDFEIQMMPADEIEVLIIREFFKFKKFYNDIPELIILEFFRFYNMLRYDLLIYLKVLNMLLENFKDKSSTSGSSENILELIYKISHDLISKHVDKWENIKKFSIFEKNCKRSHKDLAIVFVHNIRTNYKYTTLGNILYSGGLKKAKLCQSLKIACLFILFNHLLFDANSNPQIYQEEKIDKFLKFIKKPDTCINCIMEQCTDILSKGQ